MISTLNIAWAAGFLEGEGSFRFDCSPLVSASQVQKEPLERLQKLFGGKISLRNIKGNTLSSNSIWTWYTPSRRSAEIMMTIYCLMSPRRQEQIKTALTPWYTTAIQRTRDATTCIYGHPLTGDNLYAYRGYKKCKICKKRDYLIYAGKQKRVVDLTTIPLKLSDIGL